MRCPICGAPTEVKETRGVRRRRLCFNEHAFTTEEVPVINRQLLKAEVLAALGAGEALASVSRRFGITRDTARRWKNQTRD